MTATRVMFSLLLSCNLRFVFQYKNPGSSTTCLVRLILSYYHLRSTVKRERFFAHVYFSNETVSQTTVSIGPMKMFRLGHETMNVCPRNVARVGHVECIFDKIKDIFQGFGSLVSLRLQKDGRAKSKQIWTNLSHWNTDGLSSRCEELYFVLSLIKRANAQLVKRDIVTAVIYYYLIRTNFRGHLISRIWNTNISRALIFAILQKMTNLGHLISRKLTKDRLRKPFFLLIDHLNKD